MGYRTCTGSAVEELALVAGGDRLVAVEPAHDADLVAVGFAGDDDAQMGGVVVDREDLEGIGGLVADDGVARNEDRVLAAGQDDARGGEHAGTQFALGIIELRLQDEDARVRIHGGIDGGDLAVEIAVGVGGDAGDHGHAEFGAAGLLLRRLQLELHGADADDGGDLIGERDVLAGGHRAGRDVAVEGRANGGIGEGLFGLGELGADAFERGLRVFHGAVALRAPC